MDQVPVYILAGGRSERFGSDKALAELHGERLIERVCRMIQPVASSVTVVAGQAEAYANVGLRTIADLRSGLGPMGGLQSALNDTPDSEPWLLLCPCDAVVMQADWFTTLLAGRADDVEAVAFCGDRWQPMPALYARRGLAVVDEYIRSDQRRMQGLLDRLRTRRLALPDDWPTCWQVNTPEDLRRLGGEESNPAD